MPSKFKSTKINRILCGQKHFGNRIQPIGTGSNHSLRTKNIRIGSKISKNTGSNHFTLYGKFKFINPAKKNTFRLIDDVVFFFLHFQTQNGAIVIPKSSNKSRIQENFRIFDFELSASDMQMMNGLNNNNRLLDFASDRDNKYYPFNIEF